MDPGLPLSVGLTQAIQNVPIGRIHLQTYSVHSVINF